jgi:hypothetical protein
MSGQTDQGGGDSFRQVVAAQVSALAALALAALLWTFLLLHDFRKGERPPAVLLFYVAILLANAAGALAGVYSLFGIRSWWTARSILPWALLGMGLNAFNACCCWLYFVFEGANFQGLS